MNPTLAMHAAHMPLRLKALRITKVVNGETLEVWKYRPTVLAARQAAADVKWLQGRWPGLNYQLEAVELDGTEDGPLVLDADEPETTEQKLADLRVEAGEYDVVQVAD